jgi:hypothetical protein
MIAPRLPRHQFCVEVGREGCWLVWSPLTLPVQLNCANGAKEAVSVMTAKAGIRFFGAFVLSLPGSRIESGMTFSTPDNDFLINGITVPPF